MPLFFDQVQQKQALFTILDTSDFLVTYRAFQDEPVLEQIPFLESFLRQKQVYQIPVSADVTPERVAQEIQTRFSEQQGSILLPGRQFDQFGTRHGRGHGWYDRLLSQVPSSYTRIGVTDEAHFFTERLVRKAWDEPVDWVICQQREQWNIVITGARNH